MAGGAKVWRLFATVSAIGATLVARKAVVTAWSKATGNPPPTNPEADDTSLSQAIGWALLSGAAVGLARMYATKKAASYWRKSTGRLPRGLKDVPA